MEKFIMRLRDLIESSGEKQVDICREMKISKQKLSAWKSGYSLPNYGDLMRLADYFEVSADYLLGRSDDFGTVVVKAEKTGEFLSKDEKSTLKEYRGLSAEGKRLARSYLAFLKYNEKNEK